MQNLLIGIIIFTLTTSCGIDGKEVKKAKEEIEEREA